MNPNHPIHADHAGHRDWRHAAACTHTDPEWFYPLDETPASPAVLRAKRVCAGCPVRKVCLADVMAGEDPTRRWGITAGLTPTERSARHRRQQRTTAGAGQVAA